MKSKKQISSVGAMCIALSLFGVSLDIASAQQAPCTECQALPRSMGARVCVPNTQNWGYFTGTWRVWPEERRPDVTFPRAVGAERVPTPAAAGYTGSASAALPAGEANPSVPVQSNNASETVLPTIDFNNAPTAVPAPAPVQGGQEAFEPKELLPNLEPAPTAAPATAVPAAPETEAPAAPAVKEEKPAEPAAPKPTDSSDLDAALPAIETESTSSSGALPAGEFVPTLPASGALPPLTLPTAPTTDSTPSDFGLPPLTKTEAPNDRKSQSLDSMKYAFRSRDAGKQDSTSAEKNVPAKPSVSAEHKIDANVSQTNFVAPDNVSGSDKNKTMAKITEPLALDGFCPVELINNESWKSGQEDWAVIFEGRAYFCSSSQDREKFMEDPMRYTPVCKGQDPLFLLQQNREVEGRTDFCIIYGKKLYLFSNAATMKQFRENPKQYARQIAELEAKNM